MRASRLSAYATDFRELGFPRRVASPSLLPPSLPLMISSSVLLLLAIVGHGLILIFLLNVSHGFGINARWIDSVVLGLLQAAAVASLGAGIWLWGRPIAQWPPFLQVYSAVCLGTLFIGLPMVTIARSLRRTPAEARKIDENVVDLLRTSPIDHFLGSGRHTSILRLPQNESFRIRRVGYEVHLPLAPAAIDGMDVLHLTDLHFSHAFSRAYFETVMEIAAAGPAPDFVMITGDFVDHDDVASWLVPVLERLPARVGKFAILGNHDYRHPVRPIRRGLRDAGFRVLEGRWSEVEFEGVKLAIGGTSAPWGRPLDRPPSSDADFRLLLSHSPDQVFEASRLGVDLMLAGHVHGGQVRLPVVGPVLMPSRFSRHFDRGFFRVGPTLLHVSQGIAGKHPFRLGCMPELARIVIRSRKDVATARHGMRADPRVPRPV